VPGRIESVEHDALITDDTTFAVKRFLGTIQNAVKTQIWCAVATYALIAIVKKELKLDVSLYTCLQNLSVSIFEKPICHAPFSPRNTEQTITSPATR
jgi:hypothetical protein